MCGRYILSSSPSDISEHFGVDVRDNFPPRYNIAPTQPIGIIRINEMRLTEYALVRWGLIPSWMKEEKGRPLTNARAETVREKPSFRSAIKRRRCLVPANGFYEWTGDAGKKQPWHITGPGGSLFALAGIWESTLSDNGSEVETVAILTVAAGSDMAKLHGREPVVIDPENYTQWLEADERDTHLIDPMLVARRAGFWTATPVSTDVNNVRNEGVHLISPIEYREFKSDLFD